MDTANNNARLLLGDKLIEDMGQLGLLTSDRFDQTFINGLGCITDHMDFCHGLPFKFKADISSKVPVQHKWTELQLNGLRKTWTSMHSKSCNFIMPFTKELNSQCCTTCVHDLR